MANRFSKFWYDEPSVARAVLFNLRERDLRPGGTIHKGEIVSGTCGFSIAEADVPDLTGQSSAYRPNRCLVWQKCYLTCMALDDLPQGTSLRKAGKQSLRHRQYVVAEIQGSAAVKLARDLGLPVVRSKDGRNLANLEIFTVSNKTPKFRQAKLL